MSGCGSSASASAGGASGQSAGNASAQASCASAAAALVSKQTAPVQQEVSSTPVNTSAVRGKTLWIIPQDQSNPSLQQESAGFSEAADALGAKAQVFDGKSTPSQYVQGIDEAVSQKAAAIVIIAIDPSLVSASLAKAAAAHIPVIDAFGGDPSAPYPTGLVGHSTPSDVDLGKSQADYVLAKTNCNTHTLVSVVQAVPAQTALAKGVTDEFARLCPSTCRADVQSISGANFTTQLAGQTSNYLQRHPETNYVVLGTDSMTTLVTLAEMQIHKTVPIIGENGTALEAEKKGGPQTADVVFPPTHAMGWNYMDTAVRAIAGQKDISVPIAFRTVDSSNWANAGSDLTGLWPNLNGYQDKFKSLWGVS